MISIFNGRRRSLTGEARDAVYLQVSVELRQHLHLFKGARLAVFLHLALHIDRAGWAHPRVKRICKETGYTRGTISAALADLCHLQLTGHRVLLAFQLRGRAGVFSANRYLLFPSPDEVAKYESAVPEQFAPCTEKTDTVKNRRGEMRPQEEELLEIKKNHLPKEA